MSVPRAVCDVFGGDVGPAAPEPLAPPPLVQQRLLAWRTERAGGQNEPPASLLFARVMWQIRADAHYPRTWQEKGRPWCHPANLGGQDVSRWALFPPRPVCMTPLCEWALRTRSIAAQQPVQGWGVLVPCAGGQVVWGIAQGIYTALWSGLLPFSKDLVVAEQFLIAQMYGGAPNPFLGQWEPGPIEDLGASVHVSGILQQPCPLPRWRPRTEQAPALLCRHRDREGKEGIVRPLLPRSGCRESWQGCMLCGDSTELVCGYGYSANDYSVFNRQ